MNWWQDRQKRDFYVKKRNQTQMRSRAAFKLEEILDRYGIKNLKGPICDLGSAPGGWAQVLIKKFPGRKVTGCDLLNIEPLKDFYFVQGDFNDRLIQEQLLKHALDVKFSLITSDIAPQIDGNRLKEQAFFKTLSENILYFAKQYLRDNSHVIQKVFQGDEFEEILFAYRKQAKKVETFKPKSSRAESREVFLIAKF